MYFIEPKYFTQIIQITEITVVCFECSRKKKSKHTQGISKASCSENEHYPFRIKSAPGGNGSVYKADALLTKPTRLTLLLE
jgi:hypothetical protein